MFKAINDRLSGKVPAGHPRSTHWPAFERAWFAANGKYCRLCGSDKKVELHHIEPFHDNPKRELDSTNVIPLCESGHNGVNCHLWFGHLGNFQAFNPHVVTDVTEWAEKHKSALALIIKGENAA